MGRRCETEKNGGWGGWKTNDSRCEGHWRLWVRDCDSPKPSCGGNGCKGPSSYWEKCTLGCPEKKPGQLGACIQECGYGVNKKCSDGKICCSNGCGMVCMKPVKRK